MPDSTYRSIPVIGKGRNQTEFTEIFRLTHAEIFKCNLLFYVKWITRIINEQIMLLIWFETIPMFSHLLIHKSNNTWIPVSGKACNQMVLTEIFRLTDAKYEVKYKWKLTIYALAPIRDHMCLYVLYNVIIEIILLITKSCTCIWIQDWRMNIHKMIANVQLMKSVRDSFV